MEGPDHPAVANDANDPIVPPKSPTKPPRSPVSDSSHTYIVQIPRDQIYRVPPPEHSKIVESYRTLPHQQKQKCGRGWLCWFFVIILTVLLIGGGIMYGLLQVLYKPRVPIFTIKDFDVKSSKIPHMNPSYELSSKIDNPNERMGVSYEDGGTTSISYDGKKLGEGKFHVTSQDAKASKKVNLTLDGLKTVLPSKVEKSMKDEEHKLPVSLSLTINVPINLMGWKSFSKNLKVTCDFKVNTLGTGTRISSQECYSEYEA